LTVFFTSDTHFGDPRVLRIDKRPFKTIPEHDAALMANWNAVVSPEDEVWHLGDFALHVRPERVDELLGLLNGRKHLITGNNDGPATLAAKGWKNMGRGWIDLHGHSHAKLKPQTRQFDVGVDAFDYRPVDLETILASRTRRRKASADMVSD
jgi:calcineurin-like phosphoesterase family protein